MSKPATCPIRKSFDVPPHVAVLYRVVGKVKNGPTPGFACQACIDELGLKAGAEIDMSKKGFEPYLP